MKKRNSSSPTLTRSAKSQFLRGAYAAVPVIFGFIPVGIAYAIMARQAGFTVAQTCGMSLAVFAGASQMMAVGMYAQGAGILAMILATFILNLRHFIMATCIANRMETPPKKLRPLLGFGVTDESFAIFTTTGRENLTAPYFLGLIAVTYSSWNVGTLIGAIASDFLPPVLTASLGIALYAMFIGLLVPNLTKNWRLGLLVALTAVCNSLLSTVMEPHWSMIVSTLLCALIGVFFVELGEDEPQKAHDASRETEKTEVCDDARR